MKIEFLDQNGSSKEEETHWFHQCTEKNIPYVITRRRTSLGDVEWDYITLNSESEEFLDAEKDFVINELDALLAYYITPETKTNVLAKSGYAKNLPIEHLNDFAADVCNTLMEAKKRYDKNA
ncbi:hypothetical protein [Methylomonas sp. UP202]|uniref:hypothetical protein n=1 Tax=Methylomonas sp. UP202 TaxID=3040943 RepID=UPI00143AEC66|nr:hypothetical protein [Methylomonas sp. UP202]NJA04728.1 hypothetical protein [Methylococcaceae bacterium WWC4]WGS86122.1 hypothetical protein QC632_24285 [Methylomonas sp. UP202]